MLARLKLLSFILGVMSVVIVGRLFYWQVLNKDNLTAKAQDQRESIELLPTLRGEIKSSDGYGLVVNQPSYLLFAYKPELDKPIDLVAKLVAPFVFDKFPRSATESAKPIEQRILEKETEILERLSGVGSSWVSLVRGLTDDQKNKIEELKLKGVGFELSNIRHYTEASMSAHLLGFVGHDNNGKPTGYFGIEGYYNLELQGRQGRVTQEKDATGRPILMGLFDRQDPREGRNLKLHLDRALQFKIENMLVQGVARYGAVAGDVVVLEPNTGAILAMASVPSYDPKFFNLYPPEIQKNPIIADSYEPGSTFKVVVLAAAIDHGLVNPTTICGKECNGPVNIGGYTIRTWNNEYHPGQSVQDILNRSDNTGMIYLSRILGKDRLIQAIQNFGFGKLTGIDLQEEASPKLRERWSEIDLATASFGQGIAVTGIQMVSAVAAIANGGKLMTPQVVAQVEGEEIVTVSPQLIRQVISEETARTVTQMMINSAHQGESQWAVLRDYTVAGKTGTAQIPIDGHYDEEKTIASFVGFAPAKDPKFVMLVKLREPSSSPWAAETAAPLWYSIAKEILVYMNIPPD